MSLSGDQAEQRNILGVLTSFGAVSPDDMEPLDKVATWKFSETLKELRVSLPKQWQYNLEQDGQFWKGTFLNEEGQVAWSESGPAYNVVLMSSYAWLWVRQQPQSKGRMNWTRRAPRGSYVPPCSHQDESLPLDLDPQEIESVYRRHRS